MRRHTELPFRATSGAVEYIRHWSRPKRSLRATITLANADFEYDEQGNVLARFDEEHFLVGYHRPPQVAKWPVYEIGGHSIAICPEIIATLDGKRLKLRKKSGHSLICPYVLVAA